MINIVLAGVGGQGMAMASKILAVASMSRGWNVRISDTLGIAQRGGSVLSHVRIADKGEDIHSALIPKGCANVIIAFEPGEAARALPYLTRTGTIISATTPIEPSTSTLTLGSYNVSEINEGIQLSLYNAMVKNIAGVRGKSPDQARFYVVEDSELIKLLGGNRKLLNSIMLAEASKANIIPFSQDELIHAIKSCIKTKYLELNRTAIDAVFIS